MASPSVEDGLTGRGINLLGHLILQVLDNNLREEYVGWREERVEGEGEVEWVEYEWMWRGRWRW